MTRVTVYKANDGWRWRVQADNNEILASGEAYQDKADAEHAIGLIFSADPEEITVHYEEQ